MTIDNDTALAAAAAVRRHVADPAGRREVLEALGLVEQSGTGRPGRGRGADGRYRPGRDPVTIEEKP